MNALFIGLILAALVIPSSLILAACMASAQHSRREGRDD